MRFDDTLETVLAADLSTPFGRQSAWRQLVDLIGRRRVPADSRAIGVLKAIRSDVKPPIRAATARMLEYADPPEALARLFILDEIAIAVPVIRSARLSSDEWIALLPLMAPQARTVLRNRRDIGPRVVRALEAFGTIDLVLGDDRPAPEPVALAMDEPVAGVPEDAPAIDCPEMGPPLVDGDDTGADKGATVPDMSLIEQSDASMTQQDDTLDDTPRHRGAPRFVQFGAVALGIPVVAQAVRMAGDADDTAHVPASDDAAAVPMGGPGVADEQLVVADTLPEGTVVPVDTGLPMMDQPLPNPVEGDTVVVLDGGVSTMFSASDAVEAGDEMAPPSPILPVADALRLAESFPVDSPVVEDALLAADVPFSGESGHAPVTDAPADDASEATLTDPLELVSDEGAKADDAALDVPEVLAPISGAEADAGAPTPLLETHVGVAAMGGLAILSAVSGWSRGLAGHLDSGVTSKVDDTPVAADQLEAVLSDDPSVDDALTGTDAVAADGADSLFDDARAPDSAADDVQAVAVEADEVAPAASVEVEVRDVPTADLGDGVGSPLALAGISAAALFGPVLLSAQGGGAIDHAVQDDEPAQDEGDPAVADATAAIVADEAVTDDAVAVDLADAPVIADEDDAADDSDNAIMPLEQQNDGPPPRADDAGRTFRIADVVARIDAYQKRQADEAISPPVPVPGEGFRFEADARGVIRWVEGVSRGALIGLALDQSAPAGGYGFDASVAGAFRHRAGFSNARLGVAGESDASGDWLVSAVPSFDPQTGRFSGYRGAARRPRLDERAEHPAVKRPNPVESLRELIHELRTPAGAITGFAELIETQMLGPVPEAYREQAMAIRTQARELLAVIDDLDLAARIEARALELRPGSVPVKRLVDGIVTQLAPLAQERRVVLERAWGDDVVKGDERAVDRLIARLLATLVGAGTAGETLNVRIGRDGGEMVRIEMTRPAALDVDAPTEPGEDDVAALGTGFALRLAVNLAQELGGTLMFGADRLTLRLPGADDPHVDQAVHH